MLDHSSSLRWNRTEQNKQRTETKEQTEPTDPSSSIFLCCLLLLGS
jgi:hypothetical protein